MVPAYIDKIVAATSNCPAHEGGHGLWQRVKAGAVAPSLQAPGLLTGRAVLRVDGNFPNHHPDPSKPGTWPT